MTRILITGKNGQVGWELRRALRPLGEAIALDRRELDLASPEQIRRVIQEIKPHIVLNAAAYTAVDKAESEPNLAMAINGIAPGVLSEEARKNGFILVHYSTDYVFDGTKRSPYVEGDIPCPLNVYGRTKLAGEEAIRATDAPSLIFRTSWVYSARGHNFVRTMLRLAREQNELRIVDDQMGAPTWARTIADMTVQALAPNGFDLDRAREKSGLYHLAAAGAISWHGFAQAIFAEGRTTLGEINSPTLIPISASEYPLPACRPANSCLDSSKFTATFGLAPLDWRSTLTQCFREMGSGQ
jgi:dTDP-4-dehydrorhamnose reductase